MNHNSYSILYLHDTGFAHRVYLSKSKILINNGAFLEVCNFRKYGIEFISIKMFAIFCKEQLGLNVS